jgi:uncharacterized cupredoxin-like copper-binding protein
MRRLLILVLLVGAVGLAACGGDDEEPSGTGTGTGNATATGSADDEGTGDASTTVAATLTEFTIELDTDSAAAGEVTIEAENEGAVAHEILIVQTDLAADELPMAEGSVVDESKIEAAGRIAEFPAGESASGTFTLESGDYVLICNVPAHYAAGMHTEFTVD